MVNRDINFNRKKTKRLKTIRDKKKARITRKKINVGFKDEVSKPLTKKKEKQQKCLERIFKEFNDKTPNSTNNLIKNKHIRRRNRRKSEKNQKSNSDMILDE